MIVYALLLRPKKDLAIRIANFLDGFDGPRTFNPIDVRSAVLRADGRAGRDQGI